MISDNYDKFRVEDIPIRIRSLIDRILNVEGGEVNDVYDSGGHTNWGITERLARHYGWRGSMSNLPLSFAYFIYYHEFVINLRIEDIEVKSNRLAYEVLDTGVNAGIETAAIHLQRSLNACNNRGKRWIDIRVDGDIGPQTMSAFNHAFVARSDIEHALLTLVNVLQGSHYVKLVERRQKDEKFMMGWVTRVSLNHDN